MNNLQNFPEIYRELSGESLDAIKTPPLEKMSHFIFKLLKMPITLIDFKIYMYIFYHCDPSKNIYFASLTHLQIQNWVDISPSQLSASINKLKKMGILLVIKNNFDDHGVLTYEKLFLFPDLISKLTNPWYYVEAVCMAISKHNKMNMGVFRNEFIKIIQAFEKLNNSLPE